VTKVVKKEIKKFLESHENENTTYLNLWNTTKALLRGKFIAISGYIKTKTKTDISNKQSNDIPKPPNNIPKSPRKTKTNQTLNQETEIMKIRPEIIKIETKQTTQGINETKSWVFEKISMIDKPLANITKWKREKTQITKIRDDKGDITTNTNKSRESLESSSKTYIQVNWKI
jgi:hypothetical protein